MKRMMLRLWVAAAVIMAVFPLTGKAAEVTPQTAEQVARTFWNLHHDKDVAELRTSMQLLDTRWDAFYLFSPTEGKGFVIVAADDRVRPVLAYSFHNNAMRATVGPTMSWWLDGWQQQIDELRKEKSGEKNGEWQKLLEGKGIPQPLTVVDPMLTTQWDQDEPYNDSCPTRILAGEQVRAITGCVATAMAQLMKYWNYPERGTGSHTYYSADEVGYGSHPFGFQTANFGATVYDWNNMPDELTLSSPSEQKAAVATLMYHCGVASDMYYGPIQYGSGTQILNIPMLRHGNALNGMIKYFGYSSSATGMERIKYDDDTWTALVRGELDASRPVLYAGFGSTIEGHCFVCDGYDEEDRYHFNWGWSGDGDGFFTLRNLNPSGHNFSTGQQILVGVQPHTGDDSLCIIRQFPYTEDFETAPTCWEASTSSILCSYSWQVSDFAGVDGNYSASMEKPRLDSNTVDHMLSPAIVTHGDYKVIWQACAKNASQSDSYTLSVGGVTFYDTVNSTSWKSNEVLFSVAEGDTVRLDFIHESNFSSGGVLIDNVVVERESGVGIHNISTNQTISVYPNPTDGQITVVGMPEDSRVELYDVTGRLVIESSNSRINLSVCPAGVYILRCISSDGVTTRRVIKR